MTEFDPNRFHTDPAIEILGNLQDELLPPEVNEFAHYLANRIGSRNIVPQGFVMASMLSIYDLQTGIDGFSGQPIENSLVGREDKDYKVLMASLPALAGRAFSEEFAEEVAEGLRDAGILPPPESLAPTPDPTELITEPITDIDTAYEQIIEDSKKRVAELDWNHFGKVENIEGTFDMAAFLSLRNSPYKNLSFNLLIDKPGMEAGYLIETPSHMKRHADGEYWYGMLAEVITPEEAMLIKDHVLLKGIEVMAATYDFDVAEVFSHFSSNPNGPVNRATMRLAKFLSENPGIFEQPGE